MAKDLQVVTLASGSKGNAALISTDSQRFLVDVGISCRELVKRMQQVGASPEELDGVFLTHEHVDHVKGLVTFAKKYQVPMYASQGTWRMIFSKYPELNRANCRLTGSRMLVGDVSVDCLGTRGHLSNVTAGQFLLKLERMPKHIFLAHLSEQNNLPQLALDTVQNILDSKKRLRETRLLVANQYQPVADFLTGQLALPGLFED